LLKLMTQYSISADSIREIELSVPTQNASMVDRPGDADVACGDVGQRTVRDGRDGAQGKIDLASFEEAYLQSEQVRRLMARVKVIAGAELERYFPKYWPGRVTVKLASGHERTEQIIAPKGESENPMTRQDVEEKFLGLAAPVLGHEKARAVIDEVQALDARIR
jgi:hypothetical protein